MQWLLFKRQSGSHINFYNKNKRRRLFCSVTCQFIPMMNYTIGVNIQAKANALNTRIAKPTRAACMASPPVRSELCDHTAGI